MDIYIYIYGMGIMAWECGNRKMLGPLFHIVLCMQKTELLPRATVEHVSGYVSIPIREDWGEESGREGGKGESMYTAIIHTLTLTLSSLPQGTSPW